MGLYNVFIFGRARSYYFGFSRKGPLLSEGPTNGSVMQKLE